MNSPAMTYFVSLKSQAAWLRLTRTERAEFVRETVRPILATYAQVRVRYYDAEAFTGRCTDMMVFETADTQAYAFLFDALRDTAFFSLPYFEVVDIIPALEDGYEGYDQALQSPQT